MTHWIKKQLPGGWKIAVGLLLATLLLAGGSGTAPALATGAWQTHTITFSHEAQVTPQPLSLTLASPAGGVIRYTTNGSAPTPTSDAYTAPLAINQPTVVRAQVFDGAGQPLSGVYTKSYLIINYEQTIPVMSISTEWGFLNTLHDLPKERGREWERPINVEYFEPGGQPGFNVAAGIRIHGNFSRIFNIKKSYRIYFRRDYGGPGKLSYKLFEDTPVTEFDKLVLRAGFQDTFTHRGIPERSDRHHTAKYISDQVARSLHRDMGQPIAHGRWVLLYLNGQFWGLYNLTERIDDEFLSSYSHEGLERLANPGVVPISGIEETQAWDVIVKESGWDDLGQWYSIEEAKSGDYGAWLENQDWIGRTDFTQAENIGVLEWRVNLENIFSYMFLQAYIQHTDWPGANWVVYRRKDPGAQGSEGQWRMMVWDAEDTFGGGEDGRKDMNTLIKIHSPHDSITRILEKPFIGNCALKHRFVERAREYLGVENPHGKPPEQIGQLSKDRVKAEIIRQAEIVRPFMPLEIQRWAPDLNVGLWEANIQEMLAFVDVRQDVILHHLDLLRYQTFTECK